MLTGSIDDADDDDETGAMAGMVTAYCMYGVRGQHCD